MAIIHYHKSKTCSLTPGAKAHVERMIANKIYRSDFEKVRFYVAGCDGEGWYPVLMNEADGVLPDWSIADHREDQNRLNDEAEYDEDMRLRMAGY